MSDSSDFRSDSDAKSPGTSKPGKSKRKGAKAEPQSAEATPKTESAPVEPASDADSPPVLPAPETVASPDAVAAGEAAEVPAAVPAATEPEAPYTLAIDIGGTGIKSMLLDGKGQQSGNRVRQPTPRPATPQAILAVIKAMLPDTPFERVSVGFPGVVVEGVIQSAPNLHKSWVQFNLRQALQDLCGRPTRVLNDAGIQGLGVIAGQGVELVLTLGTGMGFALFVDGRYVPNLEMAHHPFRKGRTYEQSIGNAARVEAGNSKWNKRVREVLALVQRIFNPGVIYIGGGNAEKLKGELPANVKRVQNVAGLLGGIKLWG
ncbi:MAG: ROK family protein [Myxococcales bacterium]|nr:ROK family protein [Myxococcales bacterium]